MKKAYLDANATTRVHPEVLKEMMPFLEDNFGNPSSIHGFGREAKKAIDKARARVADLLGADSREEIVFTSGGTESDNHAIKNTALSLKSKGNHIITTAVEHKAVLNSCECLEDQGFDVTYLGVDHAGRAVPEDVASSIREDTILVTIMCANNETGAIMPLKEISGIASGRGIIFHTDAVQVAGKMPFSVQDVSADLVTLSAHKMNGPKGVGALYIRKGLDIGHLLDGGGQELARRGGTENVPGIAGFGKACEIASLGLEEYIPAVKPLRDKLCNFILSEIEGAVLNGDLGNMLHNTLNVSFQGLSGESVVMNLDLEGIAVSTGSACTAGSPEPSHVLKAMGLSKERIDGAVRFSLDRFTTDEDIDLVIEKLPIVIDRIRNA